MAKRAYKILVVEPDAEVLEILVGALVGRFDAHITCVDTAEACLDVEVVEPHDLVITELVLDDFDGIQLSEHLTSLSARPVIILCDEATTEQAVAALRLGVRDLLTKPFPVTDLLDAADRALSGHRLRHDYAVRYHRMRNLVRKAVRERRELNKRIELVCRDLVGAHRRLAHRVVELSKTPTVSGD